MLPPRSLPQDSAIYQRHLRPMICTAPQLMKRTPHGESDAVPSE